VMEWYNVTDAHDNDFDWKRYFPQILRDGYAFAAISVQFAGIPALQEWDPARYAPLTHPGDNYAYDIWAQAVQGLRTPKGANPMAGLSIRKVLGTGDSQSADELSSYISSGTSKANHNVDGYMLDSGNTPTVKPDVPVLENAVEGDLVLFGPKTKTAGPNYRLWQTAGASHVDYWELQQGRGIQTGLVTWDEKTAGQYGERGVPPGTCNTVSDMFPTHYVWDAALVALNRWVRTGAAPAASPLIKLDSNGQPVRDTYGNVMGGLRLPPIDLPVATYTGGICVLYGTTASLDAATLAQLYPSHQNYVNRMATAIAASVRAGWMLPPDGLDLLHRACASDIGGPSSSATCPASYTVTPPSPPTPSHSPAPGSSSTPPAQPAPANRPVVAPQASGSALASTGASTSIGVLAIVLLTAAGAAAFARRRRSGSAAQ
jgi:LPXTG-motif cell wall-anchored protein